MHFFKNKACATFFMFSLMIMPAGWNLDASQTSFDDATLIAKGHGGGHHGGGHHGGGHRGGGHHGGGHRGGGHHGGGHHRGSSWWWGTGYWYGYPGSYYEPRYQDSGSYYYRYQSPYYRGQEEYRNDPDGIRYKTDSEKIIKQPSTDQDNEEFQQAP